MRQKTMFSPSYLSLSRHQIYYFRWPIPNLPASVRNRHIRISLGTRCPKEALRLAKLLEYHAWEAIINLPLTIMNHSDIRSILIGHFSEVLQRAKARMDQAGPLPASNVASIQKEIGYLNDAIDQGFSEPLEGLFTEGELPPELSIDVRIKAILDKFSLDCKPGSSEHDMFRQEYIYAQRNYFLDLLKMNTQIREYSLLAPTGQVVAHARRPDRQLKLLCEKFLAENRNAGTWKVRPYEERVSCLNYLQEWLGEDFSIVDLDDDVARDVKEALIKTPKNRKKIKETRDLSLPEQLEVQGVSRLDNASVNKYLQVFSSLCNWCVSNKYITSNPFEGMKLAESKGKKRLGFDKLQVRSMIAETEKGEAGLCSTDLTYWSTLIAVFTGARLNEIASLMPEDIKFDDVSQIYYFDITDDEEAKKDLKTNASRRIVPIHPYLLKAGFLRFVERRIIENAGSDYTRLLPDLTYSVKHGWGRKITRWFNTTFLPKLGLKTKKLTLHSLRHSFITSLSVAGIDSVTIKSLVGHEQGTVTAGIYTHFGVEHLPQFADSIAKLPY